MKLLSLLLLSLAPTAFAIESPVINTIKSCYLSNESEPNVFLLEHADQSVSLQLTVTAVKSTRFFVHTSAAKLAHTTGQSFIATRMVRESSSESTIHSRSALISFLPKTLNKPRGQVNSYLAVDQKVIELFCD